ncbi:hypothetical protein BH20ACI1_BH20ACI1_19080 [soil metagenome]
MKNRNSIWKFSLFFALICGFFAFGCKRKSAEQTLPIVVTNKPVSEVKEPKQKSDKILNTPELSSAAAKNIALRQNLSWTFGGKTQNGWYLYHPLICRLIGVDINTSENDFADALANWQKSVGLPPNGILDEATFAVIVTKWQSNRLKKRGEASADELQIVAAADFYDVSRSEELRKVERETYAAYKKMVAAAITDKSLNLKSSGGELAPDERFLKIVSSFRSPSYQAQLRQQSPNSGRAGLAVNSPHFTGRALDIYVGGEPVSTQDNNRLIQINTPVYQWLVKNADKFGFKPYFYEPWHWEYAPDY